MKRLKNILALTLFFLYGMSDLVTAQTRNPVVWADVPDMSIIRVGDTYYMSSTTMHMNPGLPIMKSKNLVDWEMASYAYDTLGVIDEFELKNGKHTYGRGSWASSLRYHQGRYYVSTFSNSSGLNYIYSTEDPSSSVWDVKRFKPMVHDHSLFFDDDGKVYMVTAGGRIGIRALKSDLSGFEVGSEKITIIEDADAITGKPKGLPAEGAQMFKANGKYYLFLITWPKGGMRTQLLFRADQIMGPYEGRVVLEDKGVAQGGFVDSPDGAWFGYFFRDSGAVGRIPYILPMKWEDGWPVFGEAGVVPMTLDIPAKQPTVPAIVSSDDFSREKGAADLPLAWQWNHNPDHQHWSVTERKGYLRLRTGHLAQGFLTAKNTLTQRTFGPTSTGEVRLEIAKMKDGDVAGIGLLQRKYGLVGVKKKDGKHYIFVGNAQAADKDDERYEEHELIPINDSQVYLKVATDYHNLKDEGYFYYSLDGKNWKAIGKTLKMSYTLDHFMGYRFALFNYATQNLGGYVDFDYFKVGDVLP
ncbi:glycoside hydrolase family 43 protein [Sphingobacterium corticibacterium]|uniref:Glycosyl hydrolase 43 family protein n=1 Tax=Sphingobacterium corticibacterium TaxID=2484746 RepID=A0A4Q6XHA7_9SPHI|nr:glycoside hydrolase 43 family protein [Sphingobacterium corticibacterium]RZF59291.1 glycosyl hydrolase 43 family protein [Sphingobacterium corticibacterium]